MPSTAATVFRAMTGCSSLVMVVSPSVAMYRVYKNKDVGVVSIIPQVSVLANSLVWYVVHPMTSFLQPEELTELVLCCCRMIYCYMADIIFPNAVTFLIGVVLGLFYVAIYWRYTTERQYVCHVLLIVLSFLAIVCMYAILGGLGYLGQSYHGVTSTMGLIADIVAVCLYGAPMEKIFLVLKHKSAVYFQIHMVFAATINNTLWIGLGILEHNWFLLAPNALFLSLGLITLVLYVVYHPKTHPLIIPDDTKVDAEMPAFSDMMPTCTSRPISSLPNPSFEALHSPLTPLHH